MLRVKKGETYLWSPGPESKRDKEITNDRVVSVGSWGTQAKQPSPIIMFHRVYYSVSSYTITFCIPTLFIVISEGESSSGHGEIIHQIKDIIKYGIYN